VVGPWGRFPARAGVTTSEGSEHRDVVLYRLTRRAHGPAR